MNADFKFKENMPDIRLIAAAGQQPINKVLLFCDSNDTPDNNNVIRLATESGVHVIRVWTTYDALQEFERLKPYCLLPESYMRVLTNLTRPENDDGTKSTTSNPNAGVNLVKQLRVLKYTGPIMLYCSNRPRAILALQGQEAHTLVNSDGRLAREYACFKPLHTSKFTEGGLIPDFGLLVAENVEFKDKLTEDLEVPWESCAPKLKKKGVDPTTLRTITTPGAVQYRKYYIPRNLVTLDGEKHSEHIFHLVEDLLYRYIDIGPKTQRLQRVIAIDNPRLRAQFLDALKTVDAMSLEWDFPPEELELTNILKASLPVTPYKNARPVLAFHGTHDLSEDVICAEGFRTEFLGKNTGNTGWYGAGNYFTTFPTYARYYAPDSRVKDASVIAGEICLVLSWVIIGRPKVMSQAPPHVPAGAPLTPGYTTHYAVTQRTRPIQEKVGTTITPDGDEIVSFHTSHSLPLFVVELSNKDK
eukprot:PhF_6_TR31433/c0_g1_i1/m.46104